MVVGGFDLGFYSTTFEDTAGCPFLTFPPERLTEEVATDADRIPDGVFGAATKRLGVSPNFNIGLRLEHKRIIPTVGVLVGVLVGIWQ